MVVVFPAVTREVLDVVVPQKQWDRLTPLAFMALGAYFAQHLFNSLRIMLNNTFEQKVIYEELAAADAPRLLLVAPMSGHYATLLRGTVARLIENQEVWITDWADAKMVPLSAGQFDLDDYIDYLIEFLHHIGEGTHMLAVCQPSVPAFAAAAVMGANADPCRPASLTMMGGPVDVRKAPTSLRSSAGVGTLPVWVMNSPTA